MPLFPSPQLDDEVLTDSSVPIAGVNNSLPPSALDGSFSPDAENRLAHYDALNRPRPGIIRLKQTASGSLDSIHHLGSGVFLANDGANWYKHDYRGGVLSTLSGGPAYPSAQVYSTLANTALYFSIGGGMSKFDPVAGTFSTISSNSISNGALSDLGGEPFDLRLSKQLDLQRSPESGTCRRDYRFGDSGPDHD